MADQELAESQPWVAGDGRVTDEIVGLLKLVRRLEHENASLRRELAVGRPIAA
jgi:hypothetical protein